MTRKIAAVSLPSQKPRACSSEESTTRANDPSSNDQLIRRMGQQRSWMTGTARRYGASADDAQDVVQQALVRAWQHIDAFRGGDSDAELRCWLVTILRNVFYDWRRRSAVRLKYAHLASAGQHSQPCAGSDACELGELAESIQRLTPEHAHVLCSQAMGEDYETIARDLGVPIGTVKSRLFRAREQLEAQL